MLNKNVEIVYTKRAMTQIDVNRICVERDTIMAEWQDGRETGYSFTMSQRMDGLNVPKGFGNTEEEAKEDLITKTRMLKAYLDDEEDMINSMYQ